MSQFKPLAAIDLGSPDQVAAVAGAVMMANGSGSEFAQAHSEYVTETELREIAAVALRKLG